MQCALLHACDWCVLRPAISIATYVAYCSRSCAAAAESTLTHHNNSKQCYLLLFVFKQMLDLSTSDTEGASVGHANIGRSTHDE